MYNIDRVVLEIDFDAGNFKWLFKDDVRDYKQSASQKSHFPAEAFLDACIFAGGLYDCPSFPSLAGSSSISPAFTFDRALDLLRTYGTGLIAIREQLPAENTDYTEKFARTKAMLTHMIIMNDKSKFQTMSTEKMPNDLAMVITPRLADEIYFYIFKRLVGTSMFDLLMSDSIKVPTPLDGGEAQEQRDLVQKMMPLTLTCLALLSGHSNRFFHHKHLVLSPFSLLISRR